MEPAPERRFGKAWCMECEKDPTAQCEAEYHDITVVEIPPGGFPPNEAS